MPSPPHIRVGHLWARSTDVRVQNMLWLLNFALVIVALVAIRKLLQRFDGLTARLDETQRRLDDLGGEIDRIRPAGPRQPRPGSVPGVAGATSADLPAAPMNPATPSITVATAAAPAPRRASADDDKPITEPFPPRTAGEGSVPPIAPPPAIPRHPRPRLPLPPSRSVSARAGRFGSAASLSRSAACCWCATRSSRATSAPARASLMGLVFAALLAGAGEWFRRNERDLGLDRHSDRAYPGHPHRRRHGHRVRRHLCGHALYGLIGSATAFVLLGAIGIATMFAAALHGPALAGARPRRLLRRAACWCPHARPSPWPVVHLSRASSRRLPWVSRALRHWLWLAALAVAGAVRHGASSILDQAGHLTWQRLASRRLSARRYPTRSRRRVHRRRAQSRHARRRCQARPDRDRRARRLRCSPSPFSCWAKAARCLPPVSRSRSPPRRSCWPPAWLTAPAVARRASVRAGHPRGRRDMARRRAPLEQDAAALHDIGATALDSRDDHRAS